MRCRDEGEPSGVVTEMHAANEIGQLLVFSHHVQKLTSFLLLVGRELVEIVERIEEDRAHTRGAHNIVGEHLFVQLSQFGDGERRDNFHDALIKNLIELNVFVLHLVQGLFNVFQADGLGQLAQDGHVGAVGLDVDGLSKNMEVLEKLNGLIGALCEVEADEDGGEDSVKGLHILTDHHPE